MGEVETTSVGPTGGFIARVQPARGRVVKTHSKIDARGRNRGRRRLLPFQTPWLERKGNSHVVRPTPEKVKRTTTTEKDRGRVKEKKRVNV